MSEAEHIIKPEKLTISEIITITNQRKKLRLSEQSEKNIIKCRNYLDQKTETTDQPIYGVNTGFGSLCDTSISSNELSKLQKNLVISHACGIGEEVPAEVVKLILLLKIQGLSIGNSGVQLETVQRLIDFYNNDILPIIYQQGSLGASGDLAPLAHMSLPVLGLGEVRMNGKRLEGSELEKIKNWKPIQLKSKEGLALLNGTQFMSAYGTCMLMKLRKLVDTGNLVAAVSFEAFNARIEPFHQLIHRARPHNGQLKTAEFFTETLAGSELLNAEKKQVQDPYSFRCIPQVHGASIDAINHIEHIFETEINSVTDNPTIFPDDDLVISAGNFHGQPLAINLDFLAIAVSELGSISERRVYKLISGQHDLPAFLSPNPGLNSGFMIPQYTAASIVSQNKQLATPASIDTIDSSNGQEDHVSMGANAATKAYRVIENYEKLIGIELLNAAQALNFRRPLKSSAKIESFIQAYRKEVPFQENDDVMYQYIRKSIDFIKRQ